MLLVNKLNNFSNYLNTTVVIPKSIQYINSNNTSSNRFNYYSSGINKNNNNNNKNKNEVESKQLDQEFEKINNELADLPKEALDRVMGKGRKQRVRPPAIHLRKNNDWRHLPTHALAIRHRLNAINDSTWNKLIVQEETKQLQSINNSAFSFGLSNVVVDRSSSADTESRVAIKSKLKQSLVNQWREESRSYVRNIQKQQHNSIKQQLHKTKRLLKEKENQHPIHQFNDKNPFQNFFNLTKIDEIILQSSILKQQQIDQKQQQQQEGDIQSSISFKDRVYLHLYSIQLYIHNNLYKRTSSFVNDHIDCYYPLSAEQKNKIEKLTDNQDYLAIIQFANQLHEKQLQQQQVSNKIGGLQTSLVYQHLFRYLKSKSKLYLFLSTLEREYVRERLKPSDYSNFINAFLSLGQMTSADFVIQNMIDNAVDIPTDLLTIYLEYYYQKNIPFQQFIDKLDELSIFTGERDETIVQKQNYDQAVKDSFDKDQDYDDVDDNGDDLLGDGISDSINTSRISRDLNFYKSLLAHCYQNRQVEMAELIEQRMENEKIYPDLELFNLKLKMTAELGHIISSDVVEQHSVTKVKPNGHTFLAILYSSLVKFEELAEAKHLLSTLEKQWKFNRNQFILTCLVFGYSKLNHSLEKRTTDLLLQEMKQYREQRPMNHAILSYALSYYSHSAQSIELILNDLDTNEFTNSILDLIVYGYLLNNNNHRQSLIKKQQNNKQQLQQTTIDRYKDLMNILRYIKNRFNKKPDNQCMEYIKSEIRNSTSLSKKSKNALTEELLTIC